MSRTDSRRRPRSRLLRSILVNGSALLITVALLVASNARFGW